ncbi:aminoglycoside phosphotransferase family protein [Arthrobacter sp. VKM Ac-2550]|uniref:phosphotransferase n=1 Tax=Crystallibacter permensis TaxID=1938888 RepID=UPI0022260119|nr:aminoglycoside phosphotransferase family protein [Arthrobacter sp. VKM Ac-2550]MCW2132071.1 Phosphotransferase enzyme family protein [Arthrobacter sp. VKM Ac-2550]
MNDDGGRQLGEGGWTKVVRIGDTVRRPVRPFTATVQLYLAYLHAQGFDAAPLPLGYDDAGREVLSYVPGDIPVEPLPAEATGADILVELARLIRRLHDAAQGWLPPEGVVFGSLPGIHPSGVRPLFAAPELVSHQDYCPGNVVFRNGVPAALIDFDLARPTTRVADIVNALYWWAPLLHQTDRAPALAEADIPARVRLFADAYGMNAEQRSRLVDVAIQRSRNASLTAKAAADADPVFKRWWDEGVKDRMPRAEAWLRDNADLIRAAL